MSKADEAAAIAAEKQKIQISLERHPVVSLEQWLEARLALLDKEKAFSKLEDELAAQRRALPWVKVEKDYAFTTPEGDVSLKELFGEHSQLFVKHFMMGPGQAWQCAGCTLEASHVDGLLDYLDHHDTAYVAVARAPIDEILAVKKRMGWRFRWVSSSPSDFNYDFHVSFRPEELERGRAFYNFREFDPQGNADLSGNSVFYKDASGAIFHAYGAFGRGCEQFLGIYGILDVLPKGREEYGPTRSLPDWASFKVKGIHDCHCGS